MARAAKTVDAVESLKPHPALQPTIVGQRVHQTVARLLERSVRKPHALDVLSLARDIVKTPGLAVPYQQSAIQRLGAATASYFRCFALEEEWAYAGSEIVVAGCRFDFVFRRGAEILADELKAGRFADKIERTRADEQVERQLAAGVSKWKDNFLGVRVLFLAAPRASYLARPDGEREQLEWSENR